MAQNPPPNPGPIFKFGGPLPGSYPPPPVQPGYPQQAGYPPLQAGYPSPQLGYPPPPAQAGYPQQPPPSQQGPTNIVVTQPIVQVQTFHSVPVKTVCQYCRVEVLTFTHFESGTFSWIICIVLFLFGCNLGCCLIPFCMKECQDVVHTCPNCHQQIAIWSRI